MWPSTHEELIGTTTLAAQPIRLLPVLSHPETTPRPKSATRRDPIPLSHQTGSILLDGNPRTARRAAAGAAGQPSRRRGRQ